MCVFARVHMHVSLQPDVGLEVDEAGVAESVGDDDAGVATSVGDSEHVSPKVSVSALRIRSFLRFALSKKACISSSAIPSQPTTS